jgi:hypothetical protein
MNGTIEIDGQAIERIVYRDEPVVTLPMVETLHGRSRESVHANFSRNKERLVEGKDYFQVPYEEWKEVLSHTKNGSQNGFGVNKMLTPNGDDTLANDSNKGGHRGDMFFLTQLGYLKLIKTFNDDLAWDIYIKLVEHYFNTRIKIGCKHRPNPEYLTWLREQRMGMGEERRFQEFALSEADRLLRAGGRPDDLAHVPLLQDAVTAIMRTDPRAKQLGLFGE